MKRSELESPVSLLLLVTGTVAFATGLVLLTQFHMGHGSFQAEALGLSRLVWLDLHRLSSLGALGALVIHLALHWRALWGRVRSAFGPRRARGTVAELLLYAAFTTTVVAGFAAWWLVGGAAPLLGPIPPGLAPHGRHHLVDLHHLTGLLALALTVNHVGHRLRQLVRGLERRGARPAPS
jgi:hypothetical protein